MKRIAYFVYGSVAYLIFLGTFLYAIAFVGGLGAPTSLDGEPRGPLALSLAIDAGLLAIFAVQHSVMARRWFKEWWTRFVPHEIERSTYVLCASLALMLLLWQWRPLGGVVWSVRNAAGVAVLQMLFAAGWTLVLVVTFLINHFDLFGLRQVWLRARGADYTEVSFVTRGFYKFVRHPIMLGFLIAFWATPSMTMGHLLFAIATTGYIFIGIFFEERDLAAAHGRSFEQYRREVPMILPLPRPKPGAERAVSPR